MCDIRFNVHRKAISVCDIKFKVHKKSSHCVTLNDLKFVVVFDPKIRFVFRPENSFSFLSTRTKSCFQPKKGRGRRRGGVASIKDVYSYRPRYEHRPTAFIRFLEFKKTGTDRFRAFS